MIEAIAAAIRQAGGFDPAHALIVRPHGEGFQIVSGHHRLAAAGKAGLDAVPCWVRELDDAEAFMLLATSNAQSELTSLERGMHALKATEKGKHGKSINAYAEAVGRPRPTVDLEVRAARVAAEVATDVAISDLTALTRQLAELHAAPRWLWPALVDCLLDGNWTVEAARRAAAALKEAPEPPSWADREAIAAAVVVGEMRPAAVRQMEAAEIAAHEAIRKSQHEAERYAHMLALDLVQGRPASLSAVRDICGAVVRRQEAAIQARLKAEEDAQRQAARLRTVISLEEWQALPHEVREQLLPPEEDKAKVPSFNKQENAAIEWAQWSWNPVTGCLHGCIYCYARDIAESDRMAKAYPHGFAPALRPLSLLAPRFMKLPLEAKADTRFKNVFTCSMADLFGRWVPEEWIEAVLAEIAAAPQWNFLCLTKFPKRMAEFDLPANAWMGTTVDLQARVAAAEAGFAKVRSGVRWLSIEPMLEPLRFKRLDLFQWMVIGGSSASSKTPEWRPPFGWIVDLVKQAREAGVKVYFKTNLLGQGANRILELPFDAPIKADPVEAPAVFHYLGVGRKAD